MALPPDVDVVVVAFGVLGDQAAGLSKRDYIPLAIAIFVDICLLLVSMGRPMNRLGNLVPKMQAAEQGPVIQILSRFNEIHRGVLVLREGEAKVLLYACARRRCNGAMEYASEATNAPSSERVIFFARR